MQRFPIFCSFSTANHYENFRNLSLKMETEFASRSMTYPSGRVFRPQFTQKVCEIVLIFQNTSNVHNKGWTRWDYPRYILSERVNQTHLTIEIFTKKLVSIATAQLLPDNTLRPFTNFLPDQLNLEGQWEVTIPETSYPSIYQNVKGEKFMFFDRKLSNCQNSTLTWSYSAITDMVEAMNTLIQERHNHSENCITVKVSRRTRKVEIFLANDESGLAFFSMDLGHISGSIAGIEFRVMLRGKRPGKPEFAYDLVRIHSLM